MKRHLLLGVLVACGDPEPMGPDLPDAPPVSPGTAVTVEVTLRGQPVANVPVMFQASDGSVVSSDVTNALGIAGADLDAGGFVTVIQPSSVESPTSGVQRDVLSTFAGVEVGDQLHLDLQELGGTSEATVDAMINNSDAGATAYTISTSCGTTETPGAVNPVPIALIGCTDKVDALVISRDADANPLKSYFKPDVTIAPTIDLMSNTSFDPFQQVSVSYTNFDSFVGAYRAYGTDRGTVFEINGGTDLGPVLTLSVPAITGARMITASTSYPAAGAFGIQVVEDWEDASTKPYALDVAAALLAPYTSAPMFDSGSSTLMWSEGSGAQADLVRAKVDVYRDDIPTGRAWSWRIIAKRDGSRVVYPRLPVDPTGFDYNVIDGDIATVSELSSAKTPGGFDRAFREHAFEPVSRLVSGTTGRIVTQDLYFAE